MGLVPWTFFSAAVRAGASIVSNIALINKVPCPARCSRSRRRRRVLDAAFSLVGLLPIFIFTGFMPRGTSYWVPVITVVLLAFVSGSPDRRRLVVYIRDLRTALPLALQFGLFVTPVAFPFEFVPEEWRGDLLVPQPARPDHRLVPPHRAVRRGAEPHLPRPRRPGLRLVLFGGYYFFKRMETGIADVA